MDSNHSPAAPKGSARVEQGTRTEGDAPASSPRAPAETPQSARQSACARDLGVLERQFNNDGRLLPILIDAKDKSLLVATGPRCEYEVLSTFTFPFHVSDLLGQIELDRRVAEMKAAR